MSSWRFISRAAPVVVSLLVLVASALAADQAKPVPSPEDVVRSYLEALKKPDFKAAYGLLTPDMRGNLDEEKWVAQQILVMKLGEVTIDSYRIFPPKMEGAKAIVPNLLKSKDKYINQTGANEYELYTLVQQGSDKQWRIDQQALVETDAVHKWFPADVPVE
jgi:hypothetical protein